MASHGLWLGLLLLAACLVSAIVQAWYVPKPGVTWQWQLSGEIDTSFDVEMYDVDLFDVEAATIKQLHDDGRKVICYFSAGSYEDWRPDEGDFPESILGKPLDGWAGEQWLDVRANATLYPIMLARLDLAQVKGCDGVEPDNLDGYEQDTGFSLTYDDSLTYNRWLADAAHTRDLGIAHKVNRGQIPDLVDYFDFHLDEQCFQYDECDALQPWVDAGKAVIGTDYFEEGASPDVVCPAANDKGFSWLVKGLDLEARPTVLCWSYLPYWWISLIVVGAVGAGAGAFFYVRHKQKEQDRR